jgi:phosphatidylserine/phosphatidylglycerophosphate/cardiolipin synthase-like enzyme
MFGGRNIGREYYAASEVTNFANVDLLVVGQGVPQMSAEFDLCRNSGQAYPATAVLAGAAPMYAQALIRKVAAIHDYDTARVVPPGLASAAAFLRPDYFFAAFGTWFTVRAMASVYTAST